MSMDMDMGSAGPATMKMLLVDGVLYMNFGQVTKGKYAKIDLEDEDNPLGQQFSQLADQMDPSKQLEQFKKAVTSFEKKGKPKRLDGVEAQPYEVVVDTSKIDALFERLAEPAPTDPQDDHLHDVHGLGRPAAPYDGHGCRIQDAGRLLQVGRAGRHQGASRQEISDKDLSKLMGAPRRQLIRAGDDLVAARPCPILDLPKTAGR